MSYSFRMCRTDEDFARYVLFIMEHFKDLHPNLSAEAAVQMMCDYLFRCEIIIGVRDEDDSVVSSIVFGSDAAAGSGHVVWVHQVLMKPALRSTFHYFRGLEFLIKAIETYNPDTSEIRLLARSGDRMLKRLYSRLSVAVSEQELFGEPSTLYAGVLRDWIGYLKDPGGRR